MVAAGPFEALLSSYKLARCHNPHLNRRGDLLSYIMLDATRPSTAHSSNCSLSPGKQLVGVANVLGELCTCIPENCGAVYDPVTQFPRSGFS